MPHEFLTINVECHIWAMQFNRQGGVTCSAPAGPMLWTQRPLFGEFKRTVD